MLSLLRNRRDRSIRAMKLTLLTAWEEILLAIGAMGTKLPVGASMMRAARVDRSSKTP